MEPSVILSEPLRREQAALRAEIDAAFADVTRDGGVSWSESVVIDDRGSDEECLAARASDRDVRWQDLVESPEWDSERGIGGWSFLDPIGFRYYLPAAMSQCVAAADTIGWIQYHLTYYGNEFDQWKAERQSLLNDRQRTCVARFVRFMIEVARTYEYGELFAQEWQKTFDSHWHTYLPTP